MIIKETHLVPEGIHAVRPSDYARTAFPLIPSRKGSAKAIKRKEGGTYRAPGGWCQQRRIEAPASTHD
jgi:hypothetical protein